VLSKLLAGNGAGTRRRACKSEIGREFDVLTNL
jgi:hypothetical protein